eukprot:2705507-Amphidinium_carterae.1
MQSLADVNTCEDNSYMCDEERVLAKDLEGARNPSSALMARIRNAKQERTCVGIQKVGIRGVGV